MLSYSILVSLYFYGDLLDPDVITDCLGVTPTKSFKLGDEHVTVLGGRVVRKTGLWALQSETNSVQLSDHIEQLANNLIKIANRKRVLAELPNVDETYLDIFVCGGTDKDGGDAKFEISPRHLKIISELGARVKFTACSVEQ